MKAIKHNVSRSTADPSWRFKDSDKVLNYGWSDKYQQNFIMISYGTDMSVIYAGENLSGNMVCELAEELKLFFKSDYEVFEMPDWITRRYLLKGKQRVNSGTAKTMVSKFK